MNMAKKTGIMPDDESLGLDVTKDEPFHGEVEIRMSLAQYYRDFSAQTHVYTRAYIEAKFHGILKTKAEWEETLKLEG